MPKTLTFDEMIKTSTGTSLRGYITATREEIEAVFGEPTFADNDPMDKVTTEWYIQFDDGTFGTIYDWKRYAMGAPRMDERTEWNIGGHDDTVRRSIANAMSRQVIPAG
jgi:hypothetical protein